MTRLANPTWTLGSSGPIGIQPELSSISSCKNDRPQLQSMCIYIYILYICLNLFIMYHFTIQYLLLNQGAEHSFSTAPTLPLDPFGTIPVDRSNSPFSEGTPATNGCTLMKFSVHYTLPWLSPSTSRHPDHSRPHGVR